MTATVTQAERERESWFLYNRPLRKAYEGTKPDAPLRRLLVDLHKWSSNPVAVDEQQGVPVPSAFAIELARALLAHQGESVGEASGSVRGTGSSCDYRNHKKGAACGSRKRKRTV